MALWINNINKSTHPTVLQDKAQKPLKIRSSTVLQDQAQKPLERSVHPSNLQDQPQKALLKKLPTIHPRSSLDGPWISITIHKSTLYGDRIRGSNLREIEFLCSQIWHAQWDYLHLSSFSPFKKFKHTSKINGIKEGLSCSYNQREEQEHPRSRRCILGIITRSKARALAASSSTPASTLSKEQEHSRHEPVITLASLRALKKESPRKYFESLFSDADASDSTAMQVMAIGATSIDEQLAQMNEAIARLTRTVEEKDFQIAAFVNRLEA
ncbi:hypothetical protein FF2_039788 [Malus domestica]